MDRSYTVAEIDYLRHVVETKWLFGTYRPNGSGMSRTYQADEKERAVEDRVRTHMLAGHTAADLLASEAEWVRPSAPPPIASQPK